MNNKNMHEYFITMKEQIMQMFNDLKQKIQNNTKKTIAIIGIAIFAINMDMEVY